MDLEDVDEVYGPATFSRHVANQLPTEKLRQDEVIRRGLGNLYPEDVDWQKLHRNPRKLFKLSIEKLKILCENNEFLGLDRLGQVLISRLYLGIENGRNNGRNNKEREYIEVRDRQNNFPFSNKNQKLQLFEIKILFRLFCIWPVNLMEITANNSMVWFRTSMQCTANVSRRRTVMSVDFTIGLHLVDITPDRWPDFGWTSGERL